MELDRFAKISIKIILHKYLTFRFTGY